MTMAGSGSTRGTVCGIENCRSRRYEEGEDGYLYCENGHRKGELLAGSDDEMFESAARTRTRKRVDKDDKSASKYLKGAQALSMHLKCLQLILRRQVWFLVHERGLPEELEAIVHDLWALRIMGLESKITEQKQEFDSSQAAAASDTGTETDRGPSKSPSHVLQDTPNLVDCLALCYLGIRTLRLPITPGDIHAWTTNMKMPYRGAIKLLEIDMRDQLPGTYRDVLDPNSLLSFKTLYSSLISIQAAFEDEYGIEWPPLNVPVILFRFMKELALPLEIYPATRRLATLLQYDFTCNSQKRKIVSVEHLPEAHLIGCLVVCVKLLYPFDGARRYPTSIDEPATMKLDWNQRASIMRKSKQPTENSENKYIAEELINLRPEDVPFMNGDQIDQYLAFYQENFVDEPYINAEGKSSDFQRAMHDMFPIQSNKPSQPIQELPESHMQRSWEIVQSVQSILEPQTVIAEDDGQGIRRPGRDYVAYKKESDLPENAQAFYEEAARIAGFSLEMLVSVVFSTESRIRRWKKQQQGSVA
ncbi:unnamed protein product [Periconia digitata]|uniref:RRN7-type domain-containing protein n=1 Tax=Periconia digitata TaxID=1303443 RepID=A0A9W4UA78_9PLEO|nr:unnamed protein product [Periconia digitata]